MALADYAYYYALRNISREVVAKSLMSKIQISSSHHRWNNLTLGSIDKAAINYARLEWPKYYSDRTHHGFKYSWETIYRKFIHRPSLFDIAIWEKIDGVQVLQGLAIGKPSNGKTHLVINWVERSFAPSYLKGGVLLIILACAEEYAKLLGCKRVLIHSPVDDGKYQRYGYAPYKLTKVCGRYLCKDL